jgi:hypothetical protein
MTPVNVPRRFRVPGAERYLKQPILLRASENPAGFVPSTAVLRNARLRKEIQPSEFIAEVARSVALKQHLGTRNRLGRTGMPLFWQLPARLRPAAHRKLKERCDFWEAKTGVRPRPGVPGKWPLIVLGIINCFKRPWTSEEARALGQRSWRMRAVKTRIRNGIDPVTLLHKVRRGRRVLNRVPGGQSGQSGQRSANVLGEL